MAAAVSSIHSALAVSTAPVLVYYTAAVVKDVVVIRRLSFRYFPARRLHGGLPDSGQLSPQAAAASDAPRPQMYAGAFVYRVDHRCLQLARSHSSSGGGTAAAAVLGERAAVRRTDGRTYGQTGGLW